MKPRFLCEECRNNPSTNGYWKYEDKTDATGRKPVGLTCRQCKHVHQGDRPDMAYAPSNPCGHRIPVIGPVSGKVLGNRPCRCIKGVPGSHLDTTGDIGDAGD